MVLASWPAIPRIDQQHHDDSFRDPDGVDSRELRSAANGSDSLAAKRFRCPALAAPPDAAPLEASVSDRDLPSDAPAIHIDKSYVHVEPPKIANGELGIYIASPTWEGAIAIGTPTRPAATIANGEHPAIAVSSDRVAVAYVSKDWTPRVALFDKTLQIEKTIDLGKPGTGVRSNFGYVPMKILWNADAAEWAVAWTSDEVLTAREIATIHRRKERMAPAFGSEYRVRFARLSWNGKALANHRLADNATVSDLVRVRGSYVVLSQNSSYKYHCVPGFTIIFQVRLITIAPRNIVHRGAPQLYRACSVQHRSLGALAYASGVFVAAVLGCNARDQARLLALRFDAKAKPIGTPSIVAADLSPRYRPGAFDLHADGDRLWLAFLTGDKRRALVIQSLGEHLEPKMRFVVRADAMDVIGLALFDGEQGLGAAVYRDHHAMLYARRVGGLHVHRPQGGRAARLREIAL